MSQASQEPNHKDKYEQGGQSLLAVLICLRPICRLVCGGGGSAAGEALQAGRNVLAGRQGAGHRESNRQREGAATWGASPHPARRAPSAGASATILAEGATVTASEASEPAGAAGTTAGVEWAPGLHSQMLGLGLGLGTMTVLL